MVTLPCQDLYMSKNVIRIGLSSATPLSSRRVANSRSTVRVITQPTQTVYAPSGAQAYCPKCVRVK